MLLFEEILLLTPKERYCAHPNDFSERMAWWKPQAPGNYLKTMLKVSAKSFVKAKFSIPKKIFWDTRVHIRPDSVIHERMNE